MLVNRGLALSRTGVNGPPHCPPQRCITASRTQQQRLPAAAAPAPGPLRTRPPQALHTALTPCARSSSSSSRGGSSCGVCVLSQQLRRGATVTVRAENQAAPGAGLLESAEQQVTAYNVLLGVYTLLGAALTVAPGWALSTGLRVVPTEFTTCCMGVFASYMWIAVGVLVCLREAALHSRLSSDTYKRLNLGLLYWAVMCMVLQARSSTVTNPALVSGYVVVGGLTAAVCGRIYSWSNAGFSIRGVGAGLVSGIKDLLQPKGPASALYAALCGVYLVCWALLFVTDAHPLFLGDIGPVGQYLKRKMGAGMLLAGVVHYSLKDAADRGRLGASTFKQLNLAVSIFCIVGGWYFFRMWAGGVAVLEPLMVAVQAMALGSIALCDYHFIFAKK